MPLRDMDREQMWLLPPSLDELLPLDHPARFVAEFVEALDREGWAELGVEIEGDSLGAPAYHPRVLLGVWLYGFMTGVRSCRKLEAACRDQIPYLWLTGWQHPDHNTLWRFYKEHRQAMRSCSSAPCGRRRRCSWWTWRFKRWTVRGWPPTRRTREAATLRGRAGGWRGR